MFILESARAAPYLVALTAEEMKNCEWLKLDVVAQVEFREWPPGGHLRHPDVRGNEGDKKPDSVLRERLLDDLIRPCQDIWRNS